VAGLWQPGRPWCLLFISQQCSMIPSDLFTFSGWRWYQRANRQTHRSASPRARSRLWFFRVHSHQHRFCGPCRTRGTEPRRAHDICDELLHLVPRAFCGFSWGRGGYGIAAGAPRQSYLGFDLGMWKATVFALLCSPQLFVSHICIWVMMYGLKLWLYLWAGDLWVC
jgi:hypothetical protein